MVFNVRCFKCGAHEVRLVMGGRAIIHAQCHSCESNLLAEVMAFEREVEANQHSREASAVDVDPPDPGSTATLDPVCTDEEVPSPGRS